MREGDQYSCNGQKPTPGISQVIFLVLFSDTVKLKFYEYVKIV